MRSASGRYSIRSGFLAGVVLLQPRVRVSSLAQGGQLPALAGGRPPEQRLDKDSIDERDELQAVAPPGRTLSSTLRADCPAVVRQQAGRPAAAGALGGAC